MTRLLRIAAFGVALGLASWAGAASDSDPIMMKKAHEGVGTAPSADVKVDKATGKDAYTVAEIYAKRAALDKKKVSVRGKVTKVSAGIMDRNWIHLQDGSGDPAKGTHDLVVTSGDAPKVGDVVTARGTLAKDKDFGSGYLYSAIVEGANIGK